MVLFGERDFLGVFKSSSFSWRPFRKNKTNFPLTKKENIQSIGWWFPTHMKNSWIISQNLKEMKPPPSLLTSTRSSTKMTGWFWGNEAKLEAFEPREGNRRQLGCWGRFAKRYTMQHCCVIFKINNQSTDYNSIKQIRHPNTRNISRIFWCRRIFTKTCPICSPSTHRLLSLKLVVSKWIFCEF